MVSVSGNDIAVFELGSAMKEIARGKKHTRPTFTVCISADDQFIYAGAYDNDVTKWDVTELYFDFSYHVFSFRSTRVILIRTKAIARQ